MLEVEIVVRDGDTEYARATVLPNKDAEYVGPVQLRICGFRLEGGKVNQPIDVTPIDWAFLGWPPVNADHV
jgi:hypothetical protein